MQEIGITSDLLADILTGRKTIEVRLGKPKFIKLRVGDKLSLREDIWEHGQLIESQPDQAVIRITQLLYFESFAELFSAVYFKSALPSADSVEDAIDRYYQYYSPADEEEYGVVAITFEVEH